MYLIEGLEAMDNKLVVNQLIPFSNVDGKGNRCAIFLQGCNVSCVYCHNQETINHCNHCGDCVEVCEVQALSLIGNCVQYHKELCVGCNKCIERCTYSSSPKTQIYDVDELVKIIESYQPFIRGITISGGEPSLQAKPLVDLFKKVKKLGLTCYVDTNGFFNIEEMSELIEVTDQFLMDVKTVGSSDTLCKVPGLSSIKVLEHLLKLGKIEEVRTVLIHSFMEGSATVKAVSNILKHYPDVLYRLIKVHSIGLKEVQKGIIRDTIPTDQEILELVFMAKEIGVRHVNYVL